MQLLDIFKRLHTCYGDQHWWPAETPFEMIVGAILTQNTAWSNVEKAIANLRAAGILDLHGLDALPRPSLESLIRPAGFFRQKAERLQQFTGYVVRHHTGNLDRLLSQPLQQLRDELLQRPGIGPETADSILLYAAGLPSFVVDAYTRRLLERLDLLPAPDGYEAIRALFMQQLPQEAPLYNEYHALIVVHAKERCRKHKPLCDDCPLRSDCRLRRSPPVDDHPRSGRLTRQRTLTRAE